MIRPILLAFTVFTTSALAADRNFERTLSTGGNPNLSVFSGSGSIHLHPGNDTQVHIKAHLHAEAGGWFSGGSGDVDHRLEQIANNPPIEQNGNDLQIGERQNRELYRNISIDYEVTVPRGATLFAHTGSGDVQIDDVGLSLKADTGSGSLRLHGVHGPAALHTGSGDIDLEEAAPGDVKADTGSGSIHLRGLSGGLQAQTGSGDMEIEGRPAADWRLQTGSGSIRLKLPQDARFNLTATTGSGDIHVRQPLLSSGSFNGHHVTGSVNGGGPALRAGTGSGDIDIH